MSSRGVWIIVFLLAVAQISLAQEGAHGGYSGENGPGKWATMSPEFRMCAEGRNQSPIDLTGMLEAQLEPIAFAYKAGAHEVVNNGHTVQVNYQPGSTITVSKQTFELLQFHFHAPSENTIEGKSLPMEGHLVHKDANGRLAVVSVMFVEGAPNPALETFWKAMPEKAGMTAELPDHADVSTLLPKDRSYYRFGGSLTTPPCSERVLWMVLKRASTSSKDQFAQFRGAIGFANNRPVQPVHARAVLK